MSKTTAFRTLLILALLGGAVLCSQSSQASRDSQIERNRKEHQHIFDIIKQIKSNNKQLGGVVHDIDQRIEKKRKEVEDIQKQLVSAEDKLRELDLNRQKAARDLTGYQQELGQRARQSYMEGDLTYVDLLFQAADVTDFIDRMFFVQAILEQDQSLIGKTKAAQAQIDDMTAAETQQKAALEQIKEKLDNQLGDLDAIRSDKKDLIQQNDNDIELYERKAAEIENENKRLMAIARAPSGYTGKWGGSFMKPVPGPITSPFGWRVHPLFHTRKLHTGVDIGAPEGTPIHPGAKGKVIYADWMKGYGNCVMVDHGGGISTLYAHMSAIKCSVGDIVTTDSVIGKVGMTGYATGPHLHFEKRVNGTPVDPLGSIKGAGPVSKTPATEE
jgi:murein DD-endopeptidase MepM/ murein hydrolase activator NlpD